MIGCHGKKKKERKKERERKKEKEKKEFGAGLW